MNGSILRITTESGVTDDPLAVAILKASVIAAIDQLNTTDEAYVLVNHSHPELVMERVVPPGTRDGTIVNMAPRCSAWIEYGDGGIRMRTRLYGIDQEVFIPYGAIELIHGRSDFSRLVVISSIGVTSKPEPTPPKPTKPTFKVVK